MEQGRRVQVSLIAVFAVLGLLLAAPLGAFAASSNGASTVRGGSTAGFSFWSAPAAPPHVAAASPASLHVTPATTFPRTVVIESFTGVWCIHCPAESQALYSIDQSANPNLIAISELHTCAFAPGSGPCLDNFVPPDGTTATRGTFYNVCGYPDVFFDGQHDSCGATNSVPGMLNDYNDKIANASAVPGNVSVSQTASVSADGVSEFTNIQSGVTGSYNVVIYLMEYVDKLNQSVGYGPHDVLDVVRETLHNGPVNLVAGSTTQVSAHGLLNASWNTLNLSVVSLVQLNSSKAVQNANWAPVTTLLSSVTANQTNISSGGRAEITVHVTNSSTGASVEGAFVNISSDNGGLLSPSSGYTSASGDFVTNYTAGTVGSVVSVDLSAAVNATGYRGGTSTEAITVNPLFAPGVATGLVVSPGVGQIVLNWTAPTTGSGGVSYTIYEASSEAGTYAVVAQTSTTNYTATGLTPDLTVWFKVVASNVAGAAPSTAPVSAIPLTVVPSGLPAYTGWWISIGSQNFTSPLASSLGLFVPTGLLFFGFGAKSYAWLPDSAVVTEIQVGASPQTLDLSFVARLATIQGTVDPLAANVTVNGAPLSVTSGSFNWEGPAGTYFVNATAVGYASNSTQVLLTPGNTTPVTISLQATSSSPGTSSSGGDNSMILDLAIVGVIGVAVIVVAVSLVMRARRGRPPAG